jgi:Xaa-Pro aminopeptidase
MLFARLLGAGRSTFLAQKPFGLCLSEMEIANRATMEATLTMIETLGRDYKPHGTPVIATFRGQVGPESAFPHAVTQNIILSKGSAPLLSAYGQINDSGDTLVTGAGASVFGYVSELERTMFVETVSKEQEKFFRHMYEAQQIAFSAIKPGVPFSAVDEAVQNYFAEEGLTEYVRHHTGHSIGLLGHEAPFFDRHRRTGALCAGAWRIQAFRYGIGHGKGH